MALPRIGAYALPLDQELPVSRVSWNLDRSRAALLIHDMQKYFASAFAADMAPIAPAIDNMVEIRRVCRALGVPVFYTAQKGRQKRVDRGLQADFWGPGMHADEKHESIVDALSPADGDVVLVKHRYSAFQRSDFEIALRALGRDQLIVTGIYAHIGCLLTAADAFMRDVEPFFVADAVADFSRADHDLALAHVAGCCGVVTTTRRVSEDLERKAK